MSERTFAPQFGCCSICDNARLCAVAKSVDVFNPSGAPAKLWICQECLENMIKAFSKEPF